MKVIPETHFMSTLLLPIITIFLKSRTNVLNALLSLHIIRLSINRSNRLFFNNIINNSLTINGNIFHNRRQDFPLERIIWWYNCFKNLKRNERFYMIWAWGTEITKFNITRLNNIILQYVLDLSQIKASHIDIITS